jgi:transposase InsO family protein
MVDINQRIDKAAWGLFIQRGYTQVTMDDIAAEPGMSSTGSCYDNAAAESFFATVKLEAIPEGIFTSRQEARAALFDYIEMFHNRERLHSGIDYARPVSRAA